MKHSKGLNKKAKQLEQSNDVKGYACNDCCASFSPGWEVGSNGIADPCPMASDLSMCFNSSCYWAGQIPDNSANSGWLNCGNVAQDWMTLCNVPD
ncbi:MAG: quinohemoprotein amine dehydrogenase subunit gamma [Pirellulaceae bacterium]|jgi:hypothetical protein|nr:quinohemoprotein amine dehydrogenase subunit gamma [Pirellulaceae bacterium]